MWLFRGGLLEKMGDMEKASESFRSAWELAPTNATTLNALGYTLTLIGDDYAEAQQFIEQALSIEPENPAIMDSMGWVLYKQGNEEEALRWLGEAYAAMPDPEIAAHLGEVLWEQGDKDAARQIWLDALAANPDNQVLLETTGRYLE